MIFPNFNNIYSDGHGTYDLIMHNNWGLKDGKEYIHSESYLKANISMRPESQGGEKS